MFAPGAISLPWCCGLAVEPHSSCQVVVTIQLLSLLSIPSPSAQVVTSGSAVSGPNDTASLLVSSGLFTLLHSPPESGDVLSDLCQTLSDYNTKHSNSLLRNKVCTCFLKSYSNTLFQIHFPHLSYEQVKFLRGWFPPHPPDGGTQSSLAWSVAFVGEQSSPSGAARICVCPSVLLIKPPLPLAAAEHR